MKLPNDIAAIIGKVGEQELTVAEERKLADWYLGLDCGPNPQFSDEEAAAIEEKIFKKIRGFIGKGRGDLAKRMADYYIKLRERYKVPVAALAILGDGNKNYRPSGYEEGLLGTKLSYAFTSYKILDQDEAALRANSNPFAVVVLTALMAIKQKGADDDTLQGIKRDLYFEMEARKMPKYTRAGIYDFLKYYVSFEDTNQFAIFHLA